VSIRDDEIADGVVPNVSAQIRAADEKNFRDSPSG
jgi:hypothetical protein